MLSDTLTSSCVNVNKISVSEPVIATVGIAVYPVPLLVIVIALTALELRVVVAVAPDPAELPKLVIVTVGGVT